ncbi:DUF2147 domain-containing protein [Pandoraea nosoerga]|uniref:DUF2147 domain-containing protein n=1 Tax=Pandoraea nosoerga TaxID=2508296 RepID=A0A5E4Y6K6_9BURK|nr:MULTISPECIES: DUF2147 domain-containing protein [Pandoraea]MBN4665800.1 DUF2147 domain-containing protein [Pandoraea nosoerga]MBN4677253.1 DUF2147 domain-containing protein [Pandoraea nosoerga]MBN4681114.1 DUF2147 domain-containing protein [Pandoraea nosoerga]MBN4746393.1 DUF2147 domain-containing protein [Pandoraea nosoerga]VVE44113.1 hypothetical protein PNO31109_04308 [Pandoraea nosoerga]
MKAISNSTSWRRLGAQALVAVALLGGVAKAAFAADETSPVGVWKTIDDKTGKPKALVTITERNGEYVGTITKGLGENDDPGRICTACKDERKDQKMLGMQIIRGIKKEGDQYAGGKILDPENGTEYNCKMTLTDGGKKLDVRGYIGISLIGRTQTWIREQ